MIDYKQIAHDLIADGRPLKIDIAQLTSIANFIPASNLYILSSAIEEAMAAPKKTFDKAIKYKKPVSHVECPADFADKVSRVYHRKISELSQLYAPLHFFETSFRSFTYHALLGHYNTCNWWHNFYDETMHYAIPSITNVKEVNSVGVNTNRASAIHSFVSQLCNKTNHNTSYKSDTHDLLSDSTLATIGSLLYEHWHDIKTFLPIKNNEKIGESAFKLKFENIRRFRNLVFHHRNVQEKTSALQDIEFLLNQIGLNLKTSVNSSQYNIPQVIKYNQNYNPAYHVNLMKKYDKFTIDLNKVEGKGETVELSSLDIKEAIIEHLSKQKPSTLKDLNSITIN